MADLRPVHDLTPAEALQELEQLADNPPTYASERQAWQERRDQLQAWVLMHQSPSTPTEPSMEVPSSPEEQLDTLLAKLSNATAECSSAPDRAAYLAARNRVYLHRSAINNLVKLHDLERPELPDIPANPFVGTAVAPPSPAPAVHATPRLAELGRLQDLAQQSELDEDPESSDLFPLRICARRHSQALLGLGDLVEHYPYELDGELSLQLAALLTVLGNSLGSAATREAVA